MKKVLISLTAILLLSACALDQAGQVGQAGQAGPTGPTGSAGSADQLDQIIDWNGLNLETDAKCKDITIPPPDKCPNNNSITAFINVDGNGAPTSVAPIESCGGKHVTWKYAVNADDAPPFFIVFNPAQFPGSSSYDPISKEIKDEGKVVNQDIKINTRSKNGEPTDPSECMNYLIIVPDKGILDPVFIIKR